MTERSHLVLKNIVNHLILQKKFTESIIILHNDGDCVMSNLSRERTDEEMTEKRP
jgi:intracellular sulfur oxidation DsrE/DsrF family protein